MGSHSGLVHTLGKRAGPKGSREFKSPTHRNIQSAIGGFTLQWRLNFQRKLITPAFTRRFIRRKFTEGGSLGEGRLLIQPRILPATGAPKGYIIGGAMTKNLLLRKNYQKYQKIKNKRSKALSFFRAFMPEIVFRTTKLEGEPVTRRLVKAVFS